jgi:uncharacterized membrane protein YczE
MRKFLTPSRTVPHTTWTANSRWDLDPVRIGILVFGLVLFGIGDALVILSNLGNSPWAVFAEGLSKLLGINIGWSTFVIGIAVMLLWFPLKERIGLGTIANIVVISYVVQLTMSFIPRQTDVGIGLVFVIVGILLEGIGSAIYITCGLGAGPRQGLMTALNRITGVRVSRIATSIEITVCVIGIILGGRFGIGTIMFALLIGQAVAYGFGIMSQISRTPTPAEVN